MGRSSSTEKKFWLLTPIERKFLEQRGFELIKNIFDEDIASVKPYTTGNYNCAISTLARLLGYRDAYDRDFQKARRAYTALISERI